MIFLRAPVFVSMFVYFIPVCCILFYPTTVLKTFISGLDFTLYVAKACVDLRVKNA